MRSTKSAIAAMVTVFVLLTSSAWAQTTYWRGGTGSWSTDANWTNGEPDAGDYAYVGSNGTAQITDSGEVCMELYLGSVTGESGTISMNGGDLTTDFESIGCSGTGTFDQNGGVHTVNGDLEMAVDDSSGVATYTLDSGTLNVWGNLFRGFGYSKLVLDGGGLNVSGSIRVNTLYVGNNDMASYTQSGSQPVTVSDMYVGRATSGNGTYTKESSANLYVSDLHVGYYGTGEFYHNAALVDNSRLYLGTQSNGDGYYALDDAGSILDPTEEYIGREGTGLFEQWDGTNHTRYLYLGRYSSGDGTYDLIGGTLEGMAGGLADEYVGHQGHGEFWQSGGINRANVLYLGHSASGDGSYDLSGTGELTANDEFVGWSGTGSFWQATGTTNTTEELYIASGSSSQGTYNLEGGQLRATEAEYVGAGGDASFVQTGGANTSGLLHVSTPDSGGNTAIYELSGGELTADREYVGERGGHGKIDQWGGSQNTVNDILYVAYMRGSTGDYELGSSYLSVGNLGEPPYSGSVSWDNPGSEYIGMGSRDFTHGGGVGTLTMEGGTNTVASRLYVGYQHNATGTYSQSAGITDADYLCMAVNYGSQAEYILGASESGIAQLHARGECVGWGGSATFTQDYDSANVVDQDFVVGRYACAWGQYILNNGSLTADREFIKYGRFTQNGGTNTTRKLYAGTMSTTAGHWTWGWGGVGGFWWAWVPRETKYAKYTLNGGTLDVTDPMCAYIGYEGSAVFEHNNSDFSIAGALHVGYADESPGMYAYNASSSGLLTANQDIRIGADSGLGRFEWFGTNGYIDTQWFTLGDKGTLAMGYDFNVNDLSYGTLPLFAEPTYVNGLGQATLEITNDAEATHNGGPQTFRALRVGSHTGGGTFVHSGGYETINYLEVNSNGRYEYTGGSLDIDNGGLHVAGELDFVGSSVTLNVDTNALVNLADATILGPSYASLHINGSNSLTILPPGFSPGQFYSYQNYGREHTAGNTLVIESWQDYMFQGQIGDLVQCDGSLTATTNGYIHLLNGLEISGSEYSGVDLGTGVLLVNDIGFSSLSEGAQLAVGDMAIGFDAGTGGFAQDGGSVAVAGDLLLGCDSASEGSYTLANSGGIEAANIYVGFDGTGTVEHYGGDMAAKYDIVVGFGPESDGTLILFSVTSNLMGGFAVKCTTVGYEGTGLFIQENGTHTVGGNLDLGAEEGSEGTYQIHHGQLETDKLNVGLSGCGSFEVLSADPIIIVKELLRFGQDSNFEAVAGAAIHMTGADFENANTNGADLAGLNNLTLVFEGGSAEDSLELELACEDKGTVMGVYDTTFTLDTLTIGDADVSTVGLVDRTDNGYREGDGGDPEALYVDSLVLNAGCVLDLNDLHLYWRTQFVDNGGTVLNGEIHEVKVVDFDDDGDVDLDDYANHFVPCLLGPGGGAVGNCSEVDLDSDGDVDLADFALFQVFHTG